MELARSEPFGLWFLVDGVCVCAVFFSRFAFRLLSLYLVMAVARQKGSVSIFDFFHSMQPHNLTFHEIVCSCEKTFRPLKSAIPHILRCLGCIIENYTSLIGIPFTARGSHLPNSVVFIPLFMGSFSRFMELDWVSSRRCQHDITQRA